MSSIAAEHFGELRPAGLGDVTFEDLVERFKVLMFKARPAFFLPTPRRLRGGTA